MQYYKDLPEILSSGPDSDGFIELEVKGKVERLLDDDKEPIVFVGAMGETAYLVHGKINEYEYIPEEMSAGDYDFTRMTIEGSCITWY